VSQPSSLIVLLAQVAGLAIAVLVLRRHAASSRHALVAVAAAAVMAAVAAPQLVQSFHGLRETRKATAHVTAADARVKCLGDAGAPAWIDRVGRLRTALDADTRFLLRARTAPPLTCLAFAMLPRIVVERAADADVVVYADAVPQRVRRAAATGQPGARLLDDDLAVVELRP
jgi:hypothetical protein